MHRSVKKITFMLWSCMSWHALALPVAAQVAESPPPGGLSTTFGTANVLSSGASSAALSSEKATSTSSEVEPPFDFRRWSECREECSSEMRGCLNYAQATFLRCQSDCRTPVVNPDYADCIDICNADNRNYTAKCVRRGAYCEILCDVEYGLFVLPIFRL